MIEIDVGNPHGGRVLVLESLWGSRVPKENQRTCLQLTDEGNHAGITIVLDRSWTIKLKLNQLLPPAGAAVR